MLEHPSAARSCKALFFRGQWLQAGIEYVERYCLCCYAYRRYSGSTAGRIFAKTREASQEP